VRATYSEVKRLCCLVLLVGCEKSAPPSAVAATTSDGWRCFERAAGQPPLPQGDVTHTRQRVKDGALEVETVHVQAGRGGATRLRFVPAGDHLEATFEGVPVKVTLHAQDGSRWTLAYADRQGLTFTEDNVIENGALTVTSNDPGESGPVTTQVRFVPTACANVVAELAKYP